MLAIFGFRRNRHQTQGPEAEAEVYVDGCHFVATATSGFVCINTENAQLTTHKLTWTLKGGCIKSPPG